jgi:hypothetical protein
MVRKALTPLFRVRREVHTAPNAVEIRSLNRSLIRRTRGQLVTLPLYEGRAGPGVLNHNPSAPAVAPVVIRLYACEGPA